MRLTARSRIKEIKKTPISVARLPLLTL